MSDPPAITFHFRLLRRRLKRDSQRKLCQSAAKVLDSYEWLLDRIHRDAGKKAYRSALHSITEGLGLDFAVVWNYFPIGWAAPALRTAYVSGSDGLPTLVHYLGEENPPVGGWTFLYRNRYCTAVLPCRNGISCACPSYSVCTDPRVCPCAQFACERRPVGLYSGSGLQKRLRDDCEDDARVFECSSACHCDRRSCALTFLGDSTERLVSPPLALSQGNGDSWGVVCLRDLEMGEFVMEITGEVVSRDEARRRGRRCASLGLPDDSLCLDNFRMGNLGRFLATKALSPSLRLVRTHVEHCDPRLSRLALFAARNIAARELLSARLPTSN